MAIVKVTPEMVAAELAALDWAKVDAQTDAEIEAAVASDPDAVPIFSEERIIGARVRMMRKRLGLTQAAFAERYGIPLGTMRDWEQGAAMPEATARAYLRAIGNQPEAVAAAYAAAEPAHAG